MNELDCARQMKMAQREIPMEGPKSTRPTKPFATPKSKNEPTDREPAVLDEQEGKRSNNGHARPSFIDQAL
jgi:hypothetical protein